MSSRPLVGVIACRRDVEGHPAHVVTDKYLAALREYGLAPVILPVWENGDERDLLGHLDGLLLTGSHTNVAPERYGAELAPQNTRADHHRDAAAFGWIPAALDLGLPLFGICRGFQELNVAFGGSLHQAVQNVPGLDDHREPDVELALRYAPAHDVTILPGGRLAALAPEPASRVNSLHQQGIAELGMGLCAEAVAHDGLIEAISVRDAPGFSLAVQWHPEWRPREHPLYDALFEAFAGACRGYRAQQSILEEVEHAYG
ncbi:gamma-glutamyl-gamma-aminobutyrate hydrolase family protein [Halomonas urumqiensis]|uniref:gamma-glutamyl-gamma-aminobutyrate hydrolase n=1 Tax=Halomonas urumqiensis TaxID=1684789 RepID=A0A2N7UG54_9GAMM|nr:gamma-glutamyl-gamma-aminobutyrate hydrolase family protein [Halomonas urumqiensis]PMR79439.1 gamma-glutamyl-gamma-aminobutyrate hydrolase [Halomonas urumqiensis]PTB01439.1 gamma-glutamyl-gamma-aminobutyrate hydrolase family protein [Halomonas urumqiensis]GHE22471.1 glutamine amidotransferase [Halomonas urumqiensis]